ncbi:MAG: apolipoprotein N-acyltransferase [Opitutaceae bacterium]|nr:apolipoprotein N-acyltransferase [Opitutaceae bacterium]
MSEASPDLPEYPDEGPPPWWKRHSEWIAAAVVFVATVGLAWVSFPPVPAPEFAYVLAVPGTLWAFRRPPFKRFALTILSAQAVAWIGLLIWLKEVSWIAVLLLGPLTGVWIGLWYLAAWWAMPRFLGKILSVRVAGMLGLAGLWVLIEWTRHWFLSGFPWLPLAASQWQRTMVLQIASYTGAYGISFMLIVFNVGFAAYAHRLFFERETGLRRRSPEFMVAMMVLVFMAFLPLREVFGQRRELVVNAGIVQPYIPQSVKWDPTQAQSILETIEKQTTRAASLRADLLLWPESVMPLLVNGDASARAWVEGLSNRLHRPILFGSDAVEVQAEGDPLWYNSAFVVEPETGLQRHFYAKRHLVPFGEYVPFRPLLGWLNKVVPVGDGDFAEGDRSVKGADGELTRGDRVDILLVPTPIGPVRTGMLICYEDVFPYLARENALNGAVIHAVLTNDAWYGEGAAAYQHAAHSVLRAVETRRPVIRCGNGGWSGWIDEYGNTRGVMKNASGTIYYRGAKAFTITRDMRWDGRQSLYVQYGNWFVWVSAAMALFGWAALGVSRRVE